MMRFRFTETADFKLKALPLISIYPDEKYKGQRHGI